MNVLDELPDINQLRAELNVLGGSDSPPPHFIMPTNYLPATPRYSPVASPAYSPSMSPLTINIDSDSEHGNNHHKMMDQLLLGGQKCLICQMMIQILS